MSGTRTVAVKVHGGMTHADALRFHFGPDGKPPGQRVIFVYNSPQDEQEAAAFVAQMKARAEDVATRLLKAQTTAVALRRELEGLANIAYGSGLFELSVWSKAALERTPEDIARIGPMEGWDQPA